MHELHWSVILGVVHSGPVQAKPCDGFTLMVGGTPPQLSHSLSSKEKGEKIQKKRAQELR